MGRLSYCVVVEEEHGKRVAAGENNQRLLLSWSRILGRVVIPLLLGFFALRFVCEVGVKLGRPGPFITVNTAG